MYEPLKVFTYIGTALFAVGCAIALRFLYYYLFDYEPGKIQSLIFSAVLMIVGFQVVLIGLLADALANTRKLIEDVLYRVRVMELHDIEAAERRDRPEHVRG
jgi:hypothetical protein